MTNAIAALSLLAFAAGLYFMHTGDTGMAAFAFLAGVVLGLVMVAQWIMPDQGRK